MDRVFEHGGTRFRWDESKAAENQRRHGVSFEEAATVFDDPLFVLQDASRNEERRDAVIGFSFCGSIANNCAHRGRRGIHNDYLCLARFGGRGSLL